MSTIVTTVTSPSVTAENFLESAAAGTVKFHTEREDGTMRHVQFFAPETADREVAEWVLLQRDNGVPMKAIAREMHSSIPTVRRVINAMLLTLEVEEYDTDEIADLLALVDSEDPQPEAQPEAVVEAPVVVAEAPVVVEAETATVQAAASV